MGSAIVKNLAVFGAEPDGAWITRLRELQDIWGGIHHPWGTSPTSRPQWPFAAYFEEAVHHRMVPGEGEPAAGHPAGKDAPTRLGRCMAATGDLLDRL